MSSSSSADNRRPSTSPSSPPLSSSDSSTICSSSISVYPQSSISSCASFTPSRRSPQPPIPSIVTVNPPLDDDKDDGSSHTRSNEVQDGRGAEAAPEEAVVPVPEEMEPIFGAPDEEEPVFDAPDGHEPDVEEELIHISLHHDFWDPMLPALYLLDLNQRRGVSNNITDILVHSWLHLPSRPHSEFLRIETTIGDGNCYYYALIAGMRQLGRYNWFASLDNPVLPAASRGVFWGAMELRRKFHSWLLRNQDALLDSEGPSYFLDSIGVPTRLLCSNSTAAKFKGWKAKRARLSQFSYYLEKVYHAQYMRGREAGQGVHFYFWADIAVVTPFFALFLGVSIIVYYRDQGVCKTQLYEYRSVNGLVQIHDAVPGFVPPFESAVVLHYNGVDHCEAVELLDGIEHSPSPAPRIATIREHQRQLALRDRENMRRTVRISNKRTKERMLEQQNLLRAQEAESLSSGSDSPADAKRAKLNPAIKPKDTAKPYVAIKAEEAVSSDVITDFKPPVNNSKLPRKTSLRAMKPPPRRHLSNRLQPMPDSFWRFDLPPEPEVGNLKSPPELLDVKPEPAPSSTTAKLKPHGHTIPSSNVARMPTDNPTSEQHFTLNYTPVPEGYKRSDDELDDRKMTGLELGLHNSLIDHVSVDMEYKPEAPVSSGIDLEYEPVASGSLFGVNLDLEREPGNPESANHIKLHSFHLRNPKQDAVSPRAPQNSDPFLICEINEGGVDLLQLRSEGPFAIKLDREEFATLLEVTVESGTVDTIETIKWKEYPSSTTRTTILNRYLKQVSPFSNHYGDVRYDQRPNVKAEYRHDTRNLKRKGAKNPGRKDGDDESGWIAWANGRCAQYDCRRSERKYYCSSTFVVGFTLDAVQRYIGGDETIYLTGEVYGDCKHVLVAMTHRISRIDRAELIEQCDYDGDKNCNGLRADPVCKKHINGKCPPKGISTKSKKVACNAAQNAKDLRPTITRHEALLERLVECCRNEEDYFGRNITQHWQRLNSIFVDRCPDVEMIGIQSFIRWMNRKTKKPHIAKEQWKMLDEILDEAEERHNAMLLSVQPQENESSSQRESEDDMDDVWPDEMAPREIESGQGRDNIAEAEENDNKDNGQVMMENHDLYGNMAQTAQEQRLVWNVFRVPRQLPRSCRKQIEDHVERCLIDEEFAKSFATLSGTPLARMQLTEEEAMGEVISDPSSIATVLRPRLVMNRNLDPGAMVNGSWSVLIEPKKHAILERLSDSLPSDIFPQPDDTVESILARNDSCAWLDNIHRHKKRKSANGSKDCKQPCRRSVSIAESINTPVDSPRSKQEAKRNVSRLLSYRMPEQPLGTWMCRPATNEELGAIMTIWWEAWPWLSHESRMYPPNQWTYMVYQRALGREIGWHRDNYDRGALGRLLNGEEPFKESTTCGIGNSQRDGTCVIAYSMGNCPMYMCFKCLDPRLGPKQLKSQYKICPTYTFRCGPGWISILDCMDDVLMMHSLIFDKIETVDSLMEVRVGLVLRTGKNWQSFYVDTSTLRVPDSSLKFKSQGKNCEPSAVYRGYDT